jgi:hypothetical protein
MYNSSSVTVSKPVANEKIKTATGVNAFNIFNFYENIIEMKQCCLENKKK